MISETLFLIFGIVLLMVLMSMIIIVWVKILIFVVEEASTWFETWFPRKRKR